MNVSVKRKIETNEPVQLTIDFLENMLAMSKDEDVTDYSLPLILSASA